MRRTNIDDTFEDSGGSDSEDDDYDERRNRDGNRVPPSSRGKRLNGSYEPERSRMEPRRRRRQSAFDGQDNGYGDGHLARSRSGLDGVGRDAGGYGVGSTWEVDESMDLELDLEEEPRKGFKEGERVRNDAWDGDNDAKKGRIPSYALPTKHFKTPGR